MSGHYFWTVNTRLVNPGDVAVMVAFPPFPVFVTVNWVLRFVGEPEPVTVTGEVTVNCVFPERLMVKAAAAGTLSKASRTSMFALNVPPAPTENGDIHNAAPLLTRQFERTIFEAAAGVMVSDELVTVTVPTVAVSV